MKIEAKKITIIKKKHKKNQPEYSSNITTKHKLILSDYELNLIASALHDAQNAEYSDYTREEIKYLDILAQQIRKHIKDFLIPGDE